jgi:hypothetical protein
MGCESFTSDAVSNPVACARRIRDVILNNTAPNPTLKDITTTGGNLDLKLALGGITELCQGKVGPLSFLKVRNYQDNNIVRLYYQTPLFFPYNFRVFNALGQLMYEDEIVPDQFSENYVEFDTSNLPIGVYMYTISRGETVATVKIVKN